MFSDVTLYIKVFKDKFTIRDIDNNSMITVMAVEPFSSNRMLVGNFTNASNLLRNEVKKSIKRGWFTPSPRVLIHAAEMAEGGLSEVEERAIRELAADAGARIVFVWDGHDLTDSEVIAKLKSV